MQKSFLSAFDQAGNNVIHPKKFALWIALASIVMLFVSLTSAFIVRKAQGSWYEFRMPEMFYYSSAALLISSIALHIAYKSFVKEQFKAYKISISVAFLVGCLFLYLQYLGWGQLNKQGIYMDTNASSSFVFAITLLHAIHIFGGLLAMGVSTAAAFYLPNKVTPLRKLRFELVNTYWHFVDVLWIYLVIFFVTQ